MVAIQTEDYKSPTQQRETSSPNESEISVSKVSIKDVQIQAFPDKDTLLNYIKNKKGLLIAVNTEKVMHKEERVKHLINNHISYADGIGPVWVMRNKGFKATRIPGVELWQAIVQQFYKTKSFYLIGATEEVINKTVQQLHQRYPNIDIRNYRNGYLKKGDKTALKEDIKEKQPDIVFVAMGSPKQEYLMEELYNEHKALYMGLGGSFDIYTGKKRRAPRIVQKFRSEWLYRLLKEPTRFKRQLAIVKFVFLFFLNKL
jgi:UDP-N-acetyl-D-mannosaminouronate:lipid I N-acetyl-D-mannosaminouronosyltransferase